VALTRLLHDPDLRKRMGDAAASTVRDRYTIQSMVAVIESAYLEITTPGVAAT
jgi:glycosyltransferase involved in cell wall biosynthesis